MGVRVGRLALCCARVEFVAHHTSPPPDLHATEAQEGPLLHAQAQARQQASVLPLVSCVTTWLSAAKAYYTHVTCWRRGTTHGAPHAMRAVAMHSSWQYRSVRRSMCCARMKRSSLAPHHRTFLPDDGTSERVTTTQLEALYALPVHPHGTVEGQQLVCASHEASSAVQLAVSAGARRARTHTYTHAPESTRQPPAASTSGPSHTQRTVAHTPPGSSAARQTRRRLPIAGRSTRTADTPRRHAR